VTNAVRAAWFGLAAGLSGPASQAAAAASIESGMSQCAAIAEAEARLACYDHLAGRAPSHGQASVADRAAATPSAATAAQATPTPAPAPAPPVVDFATATRNFGLSAAQLHTADQGPQSIEAHITKIIVDQNRRGTVVLDNGQTWVLLDGEMLMDTGEAVTISRAALGSFMLKSASHHSYHVRRVR